MRVVYGSLSYACAMLEALVHLNTARLPVHFVDVTVTIPDELAVTHIALPDDWYRCQDVTADMGDTWAAAKTSVALLVPSAVAKNETNVVLCTLILPRLSLVSHCLWFGMVGCLLKLEMT
jgi:RES domain-containing protein